MPIPNNAQPLDPSDFTWLDRAELQFKELQARGYDVQGIQAIALLCIADWCGQLPGNGCNYPS